MGRPLKVGHRFPNGKLRATSGRQKSEVADAIRARQEFITRAVVANQPHRRGDTSAMAESALGRFCAATGLGSDVYAAGLAYAELVSKWRAAWGAPRDAGTPGDSIGGGTGEGPALKTVDRWLDQIEAVDVAIRDECGSSALVAVKQLCLEGLMVTERQHADAINGLKAMAKAMGLMATNQIRRRRADT